MEGAVLLPRGQVFIHLGFLCKDHRVMDPSVAGKGGAKGGGAGPDVHGDVVHCCRRPVEKQTASKRFPSRTNLDPAAAQSEQQLRVG